MLSPETVAEFRRESPERLRRHLRGDLDNITLKALRKEPERRYATVEQLSADLRRHLEGLPVSARSANVSYRAAKFVRRNRQRTLFASVLALMAVAVVASWGYVLWSRGGRSSAAHIVSDQGAPISSVAVLPFENLTNKPERESFTDGLTESLIGSLSKIENLKVISRNSAFTFKGRDVDPREVGHKLNVATVLEGSVREAGDKIRVEVHLVNVADGAIIWSGDNYERSLGDVFEIQDDIARSVVTRLRLNLTAAGEERLVKRDTNNVEAYQAYAKGRYFWGKRDRENLEKSKKFFEEAIRLDPNYALAYDGLVDYHFNTIWYAGASQSEAVAKAKVAVQKIVELAPDSPEAHDGLARIANIEGQKETYRREQEKAVELAPNNASIWQNYAFSLAHRTPDALAAIRRAQELDPLSPSISTDVGVILTWNKRYDEAIDAYQKTIEAYPDFRSAYENLSAAYEAKGMYPEAVAAYLESLRLEGAGAKKLAAYRTAFERGGYKGFRRKHLEFLLADPDQEKNTYWIAVEYAFQGEKEPTLEWLDKAVAARHFMVGDMISDRRYAFLHDDPRFQNLRRRVGLPD